MCSMHTVQLSSVSSTLTLPYASLCHWDSANHISSLPAGSPLGPAYLGRGVGKLQGRRRRGASSFLFLPVSGSPMMAVALDLTVALGFRLQLFVADAFRTSLTVPLRSASSGWARALQGLSTELGGSENPASPLCSPSPGQAVCS